MGNAQIYMEEYYVDAMVEAIKNNILMMDKNIDVSKNIATKVNDNETFSIVLRNPDSNIGVTVYPLNYISDTREINEIAKEIIARAEIAQSQLPSFNLSQISAESASEHLYLQVINAEQNPTLAESCSHVKINDLIAIPRWRVDIGDGSGSFVVNHDIQFNLLHMTDSELLKIARENTAKDYELKGMSQVMREMMGADMPPEMVDMMMPDGPDMMYVLNAADKAFGASAIVSTDTLKEVQEKLGEEFYIIPSSRFEVLCVPQSTVANPADLKIMCEEVNSTEVKPDEKLSDNIYRFDGQKLTICNSLADLRQQQGMKDTAKATVEHKVKM